MKVLLTATVQSHICQFHKVLVSVLHEHDCEVHVAARDNLAEKNGLKLDFADKVFDVPFARSPKSLDNLRAYRQLKKIIDEGGYDVIHCNTPMGGIVTRLAARKARKHGTCVIYTAHGFHFYQGAPKKNWLVFYPIEKFFSRLTDTLVTITHEDHKLASGKFKCNVVHMHGVGVDESRYYPVDEGEQQRLREELGVKPEQRVLLCVGELLPNKNQKMVIHAMRDVVRAFPDAVLMIAGNGPEKQNLENEIVSCGLQNNVKMLGYCTYLEKYQRIADLLVACSHREGLPLNLVEAMLTEVPVVVSQNRGHRELVCSGINGYIVADENEMSDKICQLLQDNELCKKMGKDAREFAKAYGFENVKREINGLYFIER